MEDVISSTLLMKKLESERLGISQESNSGNLSLESVPLTHVLKYLPRSGKDSMECPEDSQMRHPSKVMDKPEEAEEAVWGGGAGNTTTTGGAERETKR